VSDKGGTVVEMFQDLKRMRSPGGHEVFVGPAVSGNLIRCKKQDRGSIERRVGITYVFTGLEMTAKGQRYAEGVLL